MVLKRDKTQFIQGIGISLLLIFLNLVANTTSYALVIQKGIVKEYNEKAKKTPLAGVELNVRLANSTVSDNNGEFSLSFLTLKPREKLNVRRIDCYILKK